MKNFSLKNFLWKHMLFILILIYLIFFTTVTFIKYFTFSYQDFDLSEQAQSIWSILHGSIKCSILEVPFLGNHLRLILFLIAPLYWLFYSPLFLLFLQTFFLGISAYPLYLLARKYLDYQFSLLIAFLYLMYPALGFVNLYEFHTETLAIPFLFCLIYFFEEEKFKSFTVFMFLALSCKENIALIIIMFGIFAWFNRKSLKWILFPLIIGAVYFLLSVQIIMPYFNQGRVGYYNLYSHLGKNIFEIFTTIVLHPLDSFKRTVSLKDALLFLQLTAPLGFIVLLKPAYLFLVLPIILQHLLSSRHTEHSIYYHYTAPLIPFIFASGLHSAAWLSKRLSSPLKKNLAITFFMLCAMVSNVIIGPHFQIIPYLKNKLNQDISLRKSHLLKLIPEKAAVAVSFEFLPFLVHRENLFSFHYIVDGHYTISNKKYELPEFIEYALINFNDHLINTVFFTKDSPQRIRSFLENYRLRVVDSCNSVVLLKQDPLPGKKLYEKLSTYTPRAIINREGIIELLDCSLSPQTVKNRDKIVLSFAFRCRKTTNRQYWIFLNFLKENSQKIYYNTLIPICHRVYPTNEWKTGEIIKDYYSLLIPKGLKAGKYVIAGGLFDIMNRKILLPEGKKEKMIILGNIEITD